MKQRLTRFVLAFRNLVNFKEQNIATLRCLWHVYTCMRVCVYLYIYVRRGLRCCCFFLKAIPEPRNAERQDCSPAFVFIWALYGGTSIIEAPLFCYMSGSGKIRHFHGTITGPSPEKDPIQNIARLYQTTITTQNINKLTRATTLKY